jgi:transcriptional regulator with XRE-family HTH domain
VRSLWDDAAFKQRVQAAVERKGVTLADTLDALGVSRSYLDKTLETRSINTLLNLAKVLDMPVHELLGLERNR